MSAPFGHLRAQRRIAGQGLVGKGGPQVGKSAQSLAQLQQPGFGPAIRGERIEFVAAHRSQQHGIALQSCVQRGRRQGRAGLANGISADGHLAELEVMAAELRDRNQDAHCFASNFRTDAISGAHEHSQLHG